VARKAATVVLSGRITIIPSSMVLSKAHLKTALNMDHNSLLHLSPWHLKTIIPIMLLKAITSHPSSTVLSNPLSTSNTINHLSMVLHRAVLHSSGRVLLSMVSHHSMAVVAVVEGLTMVVVVMKLLSWVHLFVWDLTIMSGNRWLKRAMASLPNTQIIKVLLQFTSLNQRIKVIRRKVMEDNVHHLIKIHSLALNVAEEISQISEEEVAVTFNFEAVILVITVMALELLLNPTKSLQLQMLLVVRRRRSAAQTLLVSHQMVLITKTVKMKLMMSMKKLVLLLCLVQTPHSMFIYDWKISSSS
jgi:hypothetical protein